MLHSVLSGVFFQLLLKPRLLVVKERFYAFTHVKYLRLNILHIQGGGEMEIDDQYAKT